MIVRVWGNDYSFISSNFGGEAVFFLLFGLDYFSSSYFTVTFCFFKGFVFSSDFGDACQVLLLVSGLKKDSDWLFMKAVSRMAIES